MCDACVIDAVKARMMAPMMGRRELFRGAAATAAAGAALAAAPARATGHGGAMDLTHTLHEGFPTFGGAPGIAYDKRFDFASDGYNLFELTVNEHTGTHIDAPLHFSADGASVDALPVSSLVCPLCVVDIRGKAEGDPDAQVTPDDLDAWIAAHGEIPDGACVAMLSGWGERATDPATFRGDEGDGVLHFPGFHVEAARMLLETGAAAIAVDTLSLDHGPSVDFAVHYAWLPEGRYGIECVAGLEAMPAAGATLVVGAPKHRGGTGGPARLIALS